MMIFNYFSTWSSLGCFKKSVNIDKLQYLFRIFAHETVFFYFKILCEEIPNDKTKSVFIDDASVSFTVIGYLFIIEFLQKLETKFESTCI